jgi:uncharacterized membrane protein
MAKYVAVFFLAVFFFTSCKNKNGNSSSTTGGHLSQKEMEKVLLDVHLAEAYSAMLKDSADHKSSKNVDSLSHFYKEIFARHHITQEEFDKSMAYYKQHTDELDSVYNTMLPELTKLEETAGK